MLKLDKYCPLCGKKMEYVTVPYAGHYGRTYFCNCYKKRGVSGLNSDIPIIEESRESK